MTLRKIKGMLESLRGTCTSIPLVSWRLHIINIKCIPPFYDKVMSHVSWSSIMHGRYAKHEACNKQNGFSDKKIVCFFSFSIFAYFLLSKMS